jgi:small-conductance mechanosensitive channel
LNTLADIQFKLGSHQVNLLQTIQTLVILVTTLLITLWFSRFVENKLMRAQNVNMNMRVVLSKLLRILLLSIAMLIALSSAGLDIRVLSVFGGALGVGLGFGLQRIASNYVSGFIILLDKSMWIRIMAWSTSYVCVT